MTPKSRKGLPLLTMLSTFCSFDAGFPHLCAVKARKRAVAPAFFLVQQPLFSLFYAVLYKVYKKKLQKSSNRLLPIRN